MPEDRAAWFRRQVITGAVLDWHVLHNAVTRVLQNPQLGSAYPVTRARLALWRDVLTGVLIDHGVCTAAEMARANAGSSDCPSRDPEATSCTCRYAPLHAGPEHYCPGDMLSGHAAHTWQG